MIQWIDSSFQHLVVKWIPLTPSSMQDGKCIWHANVTGIMSQPPVYHSRILSGLPGNYMIHDILKHESTHYRCPCYSRQTEQKPRQWQPIPLYTITSCCNLHWPWCKPELFGWDPVSPRDWQTLRSSESHSPICTRRLDTKISRKYTTQLPHGWRILLTNLICNNYLLDRRPMV